MSYINFDKSQLINLEYSLGKEVIRSNRAGSYSSRTIVGCNTRKYHGLLICPMPHLDEERHVLLSSLDTTIVQHDSEFNLGIRKYEGDNYTPKGHKYVRDYEVGVIPKTIYRIGNVNLSMESLLVEKEEQVLLKYTMLDGQSPVKLLFRPFLAFRNIHSLSKSNLHAKTKYKKIDNGIKIRLYDGYPYLNMQISKEAEFIPIPDWYYNIEYLREQERGYEYKEDLFVPGYFEVPIKKGESIIFSAGTKEILSRGLKRKFSNELLKRNSRNTFRECLENAAEQFFVKSGKGTEIISGFPWYGTMLRETFTALPGLALSQNNENAYKAVIDTMLKFNHDCIFRKNNQSIPVEIRNADSMLWLIWAIQQYILWSKSPAALWAKYSKYVLKILDCYRSGKLIHTVVHPNGLLYIDPMAGPQTWMDNVVYGKEVVPRNGYVIEVNALWYNAIAFALEMTDPVKNAAFKNTWSPILDTMRESFLHTFWDETEKYLADSVADGKKNTEVRPNQVIAIAMPHSPVNTEQKKHVLDLLKKELLTPRGLRSLSPKIIFYKGKYSGGPEERGTACHQGTAWPWLLQFYAEAYLNVFQKSGLNHIKSIVEDFDKEMTQDAIATISEMYDGDPPHQGKGAISHAGSVGALLHIMSLLDTMNQKK